MADAMRAPSLFRTFRDHFLMGAAINSWQTEDETSAAFLCRHFNSITAENEMKPMCVLDREGTLAIGDGIHTAQRWERVDQLLTFARDHGIQVRYHVLCWHNQTPIWFFTRDWQDIPFEQLRSGTAEIPFATKEVMLARQEAYIRDVMTHVNTLFPGVVYCWDVVNEAIEPDQGAPGCYRTRSPWYQSAGEEFIAAAFRAARKYQAPGQLLLYNDYNCFEPTKLQAILDLLKGLQAEHLVDGMGMQAHLILGYMDVAQCERAARAYGELGLKLQVTELDVHCPGDDEASKRLLADQYAAYFDMLVRLKREGIDVNSVTFWGLTDKDSWLPGFRKTASYPMLFTGERQTKPCFDAVTAVPDKYRLIRMNQVGYAEGLPVRVAVLSDQPVKVTDSTGCVIRDIVPTPVHDDASGDRVAMVDVGPMSAGDYNLTCETTSCALKVAKQPWNQVADALVKGLYYQRCGLELDPRYAGAYTHPACHTGAVMLWEDRSVSMHVPGGWHDAGDYGKYVTPGAVTVGHLLYTWLLFPEGISHELNIPESGNGVPDILNEARWELEWILRMQRSDGACWHKQTKDHFAGFIMPQDDTEQEYLTPVSTLATGDAAAVCALGARIYRAYDEAFADRLLQAAIRAWEWLEQHPELVFENQPEVRTGQYADRSDKDERFWAACELYATTGELKYKDAAEHLYLTEKLRMTSYGWAEVSGLGALCCLFELQERAGQVLYGRLRQDFLAGADRALDMVKQSGYDTALRPEMYGWGSILPLMSHAMTMIAAYLLDGNTEMRDASLAQLHYALGLNALDTSFITGFGRKQVMHPHHRPSHADGIALPVPGLIAGGPNGYMPYGSTKQILPEGIAPAKAYLDETPSADTNEIAIYWNSPAVFVFAFFRMLTVQG